MDYSKLTDFERAIHRGFLCAGVGNVPVTIIKETAQDCLSQIRAEIERLKGQLIRGSCAAQTVMETNCKDEAYNEILSFLGTIEGNSEKPNNHPECDVDLCEEYYMKGYTAGVKEQLTWKDVKCIVEIADYLIPHMKIDEADLTAEFQTEEMYYKKVLKMFNDGKE